MYETKTTRRQNRLAKKRAEKKARNTKVMKTGASLLLLTGLLASSTGAALAATTSPTGPSMDQSQTAAQMANPQSETITGISETASGLNFDVNETDVTNVLSANIISDDGGGRYGVQVVANGPGAGDWSNTGNQTFTLAGTNAATATVTSISGNTINIDVSFASVPTSQPVFTASGSGIGTPVMIVAPKTDPVGANISVVLDTTKQTSITVDPLGASTPSEGAEFDQTTLMLTDPMTGAQTTTQPGNTTFTVVNGKTDLSAILNWNGFGLAKYTATEKWGGAPGTEPDGWVPGVITGQINVQVIGAEPVQSNTTDCTVAPVASGGTGFSVPMASVGTAGPTCNLVAVADTVSIASDATEATVDVAANDIPTNSSYSVNPESKAFRAPDGSFAMDVIYPGQFEISTDRATGITTVKRLGTYSGYQTIVLGQVSESKLDSNGNKVIGGSASANLTINIAPMTTPQTPVTVPETPAPVVAETPAPVIPETPVTPAPVGTTSNTPVVLSGDSALSPLKLLGNTSAGFGGPAKSVPEAVESVTTPQGFENTVITVAGVLAFVISLFSAKAGASLWQARYRKAELSDTNS